MPRFARLLALLYAALLAAANPATAMDLAPLLKGDLRKLVIHDTPQPGSEAVFLAPDGSDVTLAALEGKVVVLNFWAIWCAPCKKEMPALNALQAELGSDAFEVMVVATGRNDAGGIARFWSEFEIDALESYLDPRSALARDMGVLGLPMTMILDAQGQEIARMRGDADWASEDAKALITAILAAAES